MTKAVPVAAQQTAIGGTIPATLARTGRPAENAFSLLASLQSSVGNQGMLKLISGGVLQRKLTINQPGDAYEQEADRVADTVMRMPDPAATQEPVLQGSMASRLQRCSCGKSGGGSGECEECRATKLLRSPVSPSGAASAPPIVHDVLNSPSQPLDVATRVFMEPRFGHDFSAVRLHTDSQAAKSARAVNALAYTVGNDIVFGEEQYKPATASGQRLLAHELTHTLQQRSASKHILHRAEGPCPDTVTPHRLLLQGMSDPGVREVQRKLNLFDAIEKARGNPGVVNAPLDEDCIFGPQTFGAVLDFQRQKFADPIEHDGKVGDHTWAQLDAISGTPTPLPALPPPASPADPQARIANVNLTFGVTPSVLGPTPTAGGRIVQLTLNNFMTVLGSADLIGAADCDHFKFGFIQICRPFEVNRVTYHSPSSGGEFEIDETAARRGGEPVQDVFSVGDIFSEAEDSAAQTTRCARASRLKRAFVLFSDRPSTAFALHPRITDDFFISSLAVQNFFFTAFSVQVPDGTLRHLQSFFWDIKYCETFGPPPTGSALGPSLARTAQVNVGGPANGAGDADFLSLAGHPATNTCNAVSRAAVTLNVHGPGVTPNVCPIP